MPCICEGAGTPAMSSRSGGDIDIKNHLVANSASVDAFWIAKP